MNDLTGKTRKESNKKLSKTEKLFTLNLSRKIERKRKKYDKQKKRRRKQS